MDKDKENFVELEKQEFDRIEQLDINNKVKTSFLNYAMSVIIARALPDARDGLKPVQRRILYGMNELKIFSNVAHKKSARIVGDVMGKYHPHGDSSIYEAMVRMAQPFSYRYTLVDGHGNFGNIDGDGAAAMRYTEARMSKIAMEMLRDIDRNTVNFGDNYDATEVEPLVLPSRFPNLLVNGATGIAVGMATNIPPHNLGEVIDGVIEVIHNPEITSEELMQYIQGPDFPTGGQILGRTGLRNAYTTGNGSIVIRSKAEIVHLKNGKNEIIVTEIPYMVNKTKLIERIAEVAKNKVVEGITDLRDESGRSGIRIVIELRKDVNAEVMLNNLYKYTQLQTGYGMNMICLVDNQPKAITLKEALEVYLNHQMEIITRRTKFDLDKALARIHILDGYIIAQNNIEKVIKIIRTTTDGTEKEKLMDHFKLDEIQAQAILDMQLRRLSGLNREKILAEHAELKRACDEYLLILSDENRKKSIIESELLEIKNKYNDPRKSEICLSQDISIENEDLIPREDVVITITTNGYAKRMKQDVYKAQSRGGVGMSGIKTHENDDVEFIIPTCTHNYLLFFTNKGRVYSMKGYFIPEASRTAKGLPLVNIITFQEDEKLAAITTVPNLEDDNAYLFFATKKGIVKRTKLSQFKNIRTNGIIAINLQENDELLQVSLTDGNRDIILGSSSGKAIHFKESEIRPIGRSAAGVKGIALAKKDYLVGMAVITEEKNEVLIVTEKGYGKRSAAEEYRIQGRGGMGVKAFNVTAKNGKLVALRSVNPNLDLIITTDKGVIIRMHIDKISLAGRNTQGVILIKLKDDQSIANTAIVDRQMDEDEQNLENQPSTEIDVADQPEVTSEE
ncbi:MAG: DNA gyrase subunit A [Roseburia sp.]|nr:DNA gyrase subunit A [Anaeroplasma bactoclasticum]MCM1195716.1 DNA gyrase subunit A [Roseburia sp.]MCM1556066.1 DNA gyrase subunit A [Anaeroplasma bactoclasticum]